MSDKRIWLAGDTHLHTTRSDGALEPDELIKRSREKGLDYIIITDHNFNSVGPNSFFSEGMLVIPGEEYTGDNGHVNIWGSGLPYLDGTRPTEYRQYIDLASAAHENGCVVSVNHPFCKKCGWHMPLEPFPMDCVEVWNSPMHIDNMTNLKWWHGQLLKGRRTPLVGGSDYHRDYYVTNLLASPTTFVYAHSNSERDVLDALKKGNSFVTNSPGSTRIALFCGDAVMGDEVTLTPGTKVTLRAENLKKGHKIVVYNNNRVIYEHEVPRSGNQTVELGNLERGFIRAEVLYEYSTAMKFAYHKLVRFFQPGDVREEIPPFAWCFTNAMYLV